MRASRASARSRRVVERARSANAVLAVEGPDDERALLPLRLQVGAADDPVAAQEREHVVAVLPLGARLVDLDQVVEAEDPARERSVPEQVVERREEDGCARGRAVELGVGRRRGRRRRRRRRRAAGGGPRATSSSTAGGSARRRPSAPVLLTPASVSAPRARTAARRACAAPLARTAPALRVARAGSPARRGRRRRWNPCRPAITRSPWFQSRSSIALAGFQFHIPPPAAPSKWRDASGPRSRISARISSPSCGCVLSTLPYQPPAAVLHRRPEERPGLDREQAGLVRPVLEDPARGEQARDGLPRVVADAACERDPVAPLDGRDRIELDARERANGRLDARSVRAAIAARVALRRDGKAANRRRAHRSLKHRGAAPPPDRRDCPRGSRRRERPVCSSSTTMTAWRRPMR